MSNTLSKIFKRKKEILINGNDLTINDVINFELNSKVIFKLSKKQKDKIADCYSAVIEQTKEGVPIYGVNTAYGAQVSKILFADEDKERMTLSKKISKSILHVDVSVGKSLPKNLVKLALLIRLNTLSKGVSGVSLENISKLYDLLNSEYVPVVGRYGSLGASGDLAQNGRVLSVLLQDQLANVFNDKDQIISARVALKKIGLKPIDLDPKAGLAFVNGDNFSTSAAILSNIEVFLLFHLELYLSAFVIQVLKGTNRYFHPFLGKVRNYSGQIYVADFLAELLKDSKISYNEFSSVKHRDVTVKIQDKYSLRCLSQFLGPDFETVQRSLEILEHGLNGVSDNPLFVPPEDANQKEKAWTWISGGNFLGSYSTDIIDNLRKVLVRLVKLNDRHLATMVNAKESNGLPPNLSDGSCISGCAMKGLQNQMGMFEVYATSLGNPISILFGVHEEGNQDVTAHGLTSWIHFEQLIDVTKYSIATNLIACAQAIDLRGGPSLLSPKTKYLYSFVREEVPYIKEEQAMGHYIQLIFNKISSISKLIELLEKL